MKIKILDVYIYPLREQYPNQFKVEEFRVLMQRRIKNFRTCIFSFCVIEPESKREFIRYTPCA